MVVGTRFARDSEVFRRKLLVWAPARPFRLVAKHGSAVRTWYATNTN